SVVGKWIEAVRHGPTTPPNHRSRKWPGLCPDWEMPGSQVRMRAAHHRRGGPGPGEMRPSHPARTRQNRNRLLSKPYFAPRSRLECTYVEIAVGRDTSHGGSAGFASLARVASDDA